MTETTNAYVQRSPVAGNGLFASQTFDGGDLILSLHRPLLAVLDIARLEDTCAHCFAGAETDAFNLNEVKTVNACTGCRKVRYCSKRCQSQSWKRGHKYECKVFAARPVLPNAVRATIEILQAMQHKHLDPKALQYFMRLESNADTIFQEDSVRAKDISVLANGAWRFAGEPASADQRAAQLVMCIVLNNSLTLVTPLFDPLGLAIDPIACSANHSCSPNAVVVFSGPRISIRALVPIGKDEEVFISYIDATNPFAIRQAELKHRYHFTCACAQCLRGSNTPQDLFSKPANQLDERWSSLADEARQKQAADPQRYAPYQLGDSLPEQRLAGLQGEAFDLLAEAQRCNDIFIVTKAMALCNDTKMWPLVRQPQPALHQQSFLVNLSAGRYGLSFEDSLKLYYFIDPLLYPQEWHPVRVANKWRFAMLAQYLSSEHNDTIAQMIAQSGLYFEVVFLSLLKEVRKLLPKSHGMDGQFGQFVAMVWQSFLKLDDAKRASLESRVTEQMARMKLMADFIDMGDVGVGLQARETDDQRQTLVA